MKQTLIQKTAAVVSTGSILLSLASPAFALTSDSYNAYTGADSVNKSHVSVTEETTVVQDNVANIQNNIDFNVNTGKNQNSMNTGDSVTDTGDISVGTTISNQANSNFAELPQCGTCTTNIDSGNAKTGYDSYNKSAVTVEKVNQLFQSNDAYVDNNVKVKTDTGNNDASKNLYGSYIHTGDISGASVVGNDLNNNVATMAGVGLGLGGSHYVSANSETGADSSNASIIKSIYSNIVDQQNIADVDNDAYLDFNSGRNTGEKNTGYTAIDTGDIMTGVTFGTTANHNFAVMNNDCCGIQVQDGNSKTGYYSDNEATTWIEKALQAFQTNHGDADNNAKGNVNTGYNEANKNNDPLIYTGEIEAGVQIIDRKSVV